MLFTPVHLLRPCRNRQFLHRLVAPHLFDDVHSLHSEFSKIWQAIDRLSNELAFMRYEMSGHKDDRHRWDAVLHRHEMDLARIDHVLSNPRPMPMLSRLLIMTR